MYVIMEIFATDGIKQQIIIKKYIVLRLYKGPPVTKQVRRRVVSNKTIHGKFCSK
jgi:hypothetical protein